MTTLPESSPRETRLGIFAAALSGALILGIFVAVFRILSGSWHTFFAPIAAALTVFAVAGLYLALKQRFSWPNTIGDLAVMVLAWSAGGLVWNQLEPPTGSEPSHAALMFGAGVIVAVLEHRAWRRQGPHRPATT